MEALIVQSPRDTRLRRVGGAAVGVGLAVLRSRIAQTNVTAGELLPPPPPAGPDVTVYAIVVITSPDGNGPGGSVGLSAGVRNDGDVSSAATTLRYYRSTDATITTSDTEEGTDAVGVLSAEAAISGLGINLNAPSTPGTYYYGACVDAVTGESDTTNNCSGSIAVEVQ